MNVLLTMERLVGMVPFCEHDIVQRTIPIAQETRKIAWNSTPMKQVQLIASLIAMVMCFIFMWDFP